MKGVTNFWFNVLDTHPGLSSLIAEEDIPLLEKLSDITVEYSETYESFTLAFHFEDNDFITNKVSLDPSYIGTVLVPDLLLCAYVPSVHTCRVVHVEDISICTYLYMLTRTIICCAQVLTKKYVVSPDLLEEQAPALVDCETSAIDWKAGKNLTVTEVQKKQKAKAGKNKGQVRVITKQVPKASFFHF
ncbi:NAP domain-containing protein, partial [archaeon]